jgi:hypothetical protein
VALPDRLSKTNRCVLDEVGTWFRGRDLEDMVEALKSFVAGVACPFQQPPPDSVSIPGRPSEEGRRGQTAFPPEPHAPFRVAQGSGDFLQQVHRAVQHHAKAGIEEVLAIRLNC